MKRKRETPTWRKWLYCLLPALAAVTLYLLLPLFPRFTEYVWVRGVFRIVSFPLTGLMSLFPFSVTEVVVVAGIPALLALAVVFVVRLVRRADRRRVAERGARFVAFCLSLFLLLFMVMDGGNFSRLPMATLFGLTEKSYDAAFLQAVTADLAAKTNAARANVAEDVDGYMTLSASKSATLRAADDCYKPLRERYPFLVSGVWRVKSVALSHLWSYTGYTGVYCPWLSEVSINTDTPVSEWGHTAAHEIGAGGEDQVFNLPVQLIDGRAHPETNIGEVLRGDLRRGDCVRLLAHGALLNPRSCTPPSGRPRRYARPRRLLP